MATVVEAPFHCAFSAYAFREMDSVFPWRTPVVQVSRGERGKRTERTCGGVAALNAKYSFVSGLGNAVI